MVFYQNGFSRDAIGFPQQDERVLRVVKNVDENHSIEALIGDGNRFPVKRFDLYFCGRSNKNVNALNLKVRSAAQYKRVDRSVSTADIQNRRARRNHRAEMFGKHTRSAIKNQAAVDRAKHTRHLPLV